MSSKLLMSSAVLAGTVCAALGGYWALHDGTSPIEHWRFVEQNCFDCHNRTDRTADLALDVLDPTEIAGQPEIAEAVIRKLRGRTMPPPGTPPASPQDMDAFVAWLEDTLDSSTDEHAGVGTVVVHRLNRDEYENEIARLLALDVDAAGLLPADAESEGFTNIANVLQASPTFIDQYLSAARDVSMRAVGYAGTVEERYDVFPAPSNINQTVHVAGLPLGTRGGMAVDYYFPADGEYEFTINVTSAGGSLLRSYPTGWLEYRHRVVLTVDGVAVFAAELGGPDDLRAVDQQLIQAVTAIQDRFKRIRVPITAGPHRIGAAFIARTFSESDAPLEPLRPGEGVDSVPLIAGLDIAGPRGMFDSGATPSRRKIFVCRPENERDELPCATTILSRLAREAFRRPVDRAEVDSLLAFYRSGAEEGGFELGIQQAVAAILSSPKFLYRAEPAPAGLAPGEIYALTDLQLASRLSFFLWSQGPDDELLALAESGGLGEPEAYAAQVRRMLSDERSRTLITQFAFQWLQVDNMDHIDPDPRLFPEFDDDLREAFRREMELFLGSVFAEDGSVLELLTARHTFVNERLARHYGLSEVRGNTFRRVELDDSNRWGLLGKGSLLMGSSYPDRTSPVLRGAWIMETLIGTPPAAPPPGVETNLDNPLGAEAKTVRARLEAHRELPSCAQCHALIDPLGLALENFNAIGQWQMKDRYAGTEIDASGELAGGRKVSGPDDLREALIESRDRFAQTFTEKLLTYALGRAVEHHDMPTVRRIVREAADDDYRFSSIVTGIATSPAFRMNRVPAEEGVTSLNRQVRANSVGDDAG